MTVMAPDSYYSKWPLPTPSHIRLISFEAAGGPATVSCSLNSFSLSNAPPYIALSYTWGAADDQHTIILNPGTVSISVTKNCHSALRRLRTCYRDYSNPAQHFWIDAVCIDQSNIAEHNIHVAMMADIYRSSSRVVIDVGELEDSDDASFAIERITQEKEAESPSQIRTFSFGFGSRTRDSIDRFYERPWFKRVWVLQEAYMASNAEVMCGTIIKSWIHFRLKWFWLDLSVVLERPALVGMPTAYTVPFVLIQGTQSKRTYTARKDLLALLCHSRTCLATDPRDKVFALYSFLSDAVNEGFAADYSPSKTKAYVYTELAQWLLQQFGLVALSCVWGSPSKRDSDLPSWVPDWSDNTARPEWLLGVPIRREWVTDINYSFWPLSAGGTTQARLTFDAGTTPSLIVRGLIVDQIQKTGNPIQGKDADILQLAAAIRHRRGLPVPPRYSNHFFPRTWEAPQWIMSYGIPVNLRGGEIDDNTLGVYHNVIKGRELAVTDKAYVGLVPTGSRAGDLVCVLLGGGVPFILRSEEGHYRLIGESYFYGLMMGERWLTLKKNQCLKAKSLGAPWSILSSIDPNIAGKKQSKRCFCD